MYLNCKTYFSFRYGTYKPEELVQYAADTGVAAMAVTDINNTCTAWDFYDFCLRQNIKPILGAEIRNGDTYCYILLSRDLQGFCEINRFISSHLQQKLIFPEKPSMTSKVWVIYPLGKFEPATLSDNELVGVKPGEINKLYGVNVNGYPQKFVVQQPVSFQDKKHFNLHRLLRAVDKNILLSKQKPAEFADAGDCFVSPSQIFQAFSDYPVIITNTLKVVESCNTTLELNKDKNKKHFTSSIEDDRSLLEKIAMEGMDRRYGKNDKEATARVKKELKIIHELGFNAYFLITWDIIRYAQSRGFFFVGRGSGANSIVAYCLQITDVDPIELDLYFERFMNPHRSVPPDFDLDFSWRDRDEVIDYIFKRYGKEHVALLGMHSTFQSNAVTRVLAKVFGLPKNEVDAMLSDPEAKFKDDGQQRLILKYKEIMKNFPNHLSIHPGGMLISEQPIYTYTGVVNPPKGFNTTQIDMFVAEKVGLYKLDILSQRGLGHIKDCIELIRQNKKADVDIREVEKFKTDKLVAEKIRAADTIGCFYIESPGMRQLLKKLECDDYLTLVAASSIIRPGVAQSGMMRQYIYRFHNPGSFEYLHPKMKELLKETYGVMVYQEDVIKVAHHFAGLDMGEADILRRAMSGKYRSRNEFYAIRDKFFKNCKEYGYADDITAEVWRQIESFGGYSFSKAHSASFAVESYQSLFLKTYYPMEFMVAVINNFGGFYGTELYFHELKKTGAVVLPPCVNEGQYNTSINGSVVVVGLIHIQGMEEKVCVNLLEERKRNGSYLHLQDFIERTGIQLEQLNLLIRINALRFTGRNKKELLWEANFLQKKNKVPQPAHVSLFREPPVAFHLPQLTQHRLDDALDEMELLGFPLCDPWKMLSIDLSIFCAGRDLPAFLDKRVHVIGYFITTKPVRTVKGDTMYFGTFLDKHGEWLDTIHFPDIARRYPVQGNGFYEMKGKVVVEFGVYSMEVDYCRKVGIQDRFET
jgi:DNA-directed DNA polymerase III PolC